MAVGDAVDQDRRVAVEVGEARGIDEVVLALGVEADAKVPGVVDRLVPLHRDRLPRAKAVHGLTAQVARAAATRPLLELRPARGRRRHVNVRRRATGDQQRDRSGQAGHPPASKDMSKAPCGGQIPGRPATHDGHPAA